MNTRHAEVIPLRVCQDCMLIHTNGDTSGLSDEQYNVWSAGVEDLWGNRDDVHFGAGPMCDSTDASGDTCDHDNREDCTYDGWFSWSDCEGCGSPLGGDRYNFPLWQRIV